MLPKTQLLHFPTNQTLVENATATWYQTAATELPINTVTGNFSYGDPEGTITVDVANDSIDLPAGKWLFEIHCNIDNTEAALGELECAITNETDGASQVLYAQSPASLPWLIQASAKTTAHFCLLVHLTARTTGLQIRMANTQASGTGTLVFEGGWCKITKVANKYDR